MVTRLLCISNGHGEDAIALRLLTALQSQEPTLEIAVLPLVGEGRSFRKQGIAPIATTKTLPSGGFIYMDSRQLVRDIKGGLVQLTLAQLKALKTWATSGGVVLAVGDIVPAAFAWWSGLPYAVVGTAKSAYYLRDEQGRLANLPWYSGWAKSIYLPWERWLMNRDRCRMVVVRDELTRTELQQLSIPHVFAGNPMMDGLAPTAGMAELKARDADALTIVLLPGSREPEAYANWKIILAAVESVLQQYASRPVHCLGAIAPALDLSEFQSMLRQSGWQPGDETPSPSFVRQQGRLILTQTNYANCLHLADAAIAMAGTATEQMVGLGKPVFITPGTGPQFNSTFAHLQTRLLGESIILATSPEAIGAMMAEVLADTERLISIRQNGLQRMGKPGAADKIASRLRQHLL